MSEPETARGPAAESREAGPAATSFNQWEGFTNLNAFEEQFNYPSTRVLPRDSGRRETDSSDEDLVCITSEVADVGVLRAGWAIRWEITQHSKSQKPLRRRANHISLSLSVGLTTVTLGFSSPQKAEEFIETLQKSWKETLATIKVEEI